MIFVEEGHLFRRGFKQAPLRCIKGNKVTRVLQKVHVGACGEHQEGLRLYQQISRLGYYWPTMEADATSFA